MTVELMVMSPFLGPTGEMGAITSLGLDSTEDVLTGTNLARQLGQEGEQAVRSVYDIGEKEAIDVAGQTRIPDGLTREALSEVKNVKSLSYTRQLRDYASFAEQTGRRFDLYVRPGTGTRLSGPLVDAINAGKINLCFIP
jgi:hypothetical protein